MKFQVENIFLVWGAAVAFMLFICAALAALLGEWGISWKLFFATAIVPIAMICISGDWDLY